jgi:hypothetical protein
MKVKNAVKTWLPIFSGFYGTIFDTDSQDDFIEQDISDYCYDNKLSAEQKEILLDGVYSSNAFTVGYKDYQDRVCLSVTSTIERELKEMGVVKSIVMEKLVSPREYNFTNDSIDIEVVFTKANVKEIKKIVSDNIEAWKEYLSNHYSSYDGFISSHSNDSEANEWDIEIALQGSHNCGSVLNFICQLSEIDEYLLNDNIDDNYLFIDIESLIDELK